MKRTPPTPDQIRAIAAEVVPASAAIRYDTVRAHIQRTLQTTRQRSDQWLTDALLAEASPLALISTSQGGTVHRYTRTDGNATTALVGNQDWEVRLNSTGDTRPTGRAHIGNWVIRVSTLTEFADSARDAYQQSVDAEQRRKRIDAAYLEENHGDALALLRGLFARAGTLHNHLDHEHATYNQTVRAASRSHPDGTRYAEAVITLRDDDINAVAAVLAELGITPADEPELTESAS